MRKRKVDFDLELYVRETCLQLSPPEDSGCTCGLRKGHDGLHKCAAETCDTTWEDWDGDMSNYF